MRKRTTYNLVLPAAILAISAAFASEGMWEPRQMPQLGDRLRRLGLEIEPDRLADLAAYPLNALVSLGGCTASFVSPEGLVITNYHCASGSVQYNSSTERDLRKTGFLARTREQELRASPGSRVYVTVSVEDVTDEVLADLDGVTGADRYRAIEDRRKAIVARCEKDAGHRCGVSTFHGGLAYRLIKRLEIRDVRLVYAPPASIGEYGGDIDNWMWPRHTGDFAFYRAYVGADGSPADHAEGNVPYRPAGHLRLAPEGIEEGDFVIQVGYPGRTNRYRLASEVASTFDWSYPRRATAYAELLDLIAAETAERPDAEMRYAPLVGSLNNSMKNFRGMIDNFAKTDTVARRRHLEASLRSWIEADPTRKARYLSTLEELEGLATRSRAMRERSLYYESLVRRSSLLDAARLLYRLALESREPDVERESGYQERDLRRIKARLTRIDRRREEQVERAMLRKMLLDYASIPVDQHVKALDEWFGIRGNSVDGPRLDRALDRLYEGTKLDELDTRLAWMEAPLEQFDKSDDPYILLAVALYPEDRAIEKEDEELDGSLREARPRYMEALIAFLESRGQPVYPDANGTLRLTFGNVMGYSPRDALDYRPFTRLEGIVEKNTGSVPFDSPARLLDAIEQRRHGRRVDEKLGSVPVNFLSDLDTTGGSSGSPTLNGRGELIGLGFDGNYEAIIADWDFNPRLARAIHVDVRYILWVLENVDHALPLLRELGVEPAAP